MRKFGTDAPEFLSFTLGDDDTVYNLPLAASLPMSTLLDLQEAAAKGEAERYQLELLRTYIGDKVDSLTVADVTAIYQAWNEESAKQGATAGE
jgi:hypothetical protein